MEAWEISILFRPVLLLVYFAAIVIPIELALKRFWPNGRLKTILFDKTFVDRRPGVYMAVWAILVALLGALVYFIS